MSHLSVLPTVLRDADLLEAALNALELDPRRGGNVSGFAGEQQPVDLQIRLAGGPSLGWRRQADGSLALVADLQRLSQGAALPRLLSRITRTYAAHLALREAQSQLQGALVHLAL